MALKAYKNLDFLNSKPARPLRILSEYLEPRSRFDHYKVTDTVVFFGSARAIAEDEAKKGLDEARNGGDDAAIARAQQQLDLSRYYEEARALAGRVTEWSKALDLPERRFIVSTGGGPGIMEAANRGASEASGLSIGLGISLPFEATMNPYITRELGFEFHYFFMRKFWFAYMAKAMIVFPGGFGTLDELFEVLTLVQTQKINRKIPIVLYGEEFWDDVMTLDGLEKWGTISPGDLDLMHRSSTVDDAFDYVTAELKRLHLQPQD